MNRKALVYVHLALAAFFAPMIILMAVAGFAYTLGEKGQVAMTPLTVLPGQLQVPEHNQIAYVEALLGQAGVESYSVNGFKAGGNWLISMPISEVFYRFEQTDNGIEVFKAKPNWLAHIIALHKNHGPTAFQWYEKAFALALIFVVLSGLYLGLQSAKLRKPTLLLLGAGLLTMIAMAHL